MSIFNKFVRLITLNQESDLSKAFNALAKGYKLEQIKNILESGYDVSEDNVDTFFGYVHGADYKNRSTNVNAIVELFYQNIQASPTFNVERLFKKNMEDTTYSSWADGSRQVKKLLGYRLKVREFNELSLPKKIEFSQKFQAQIELIKSGAFNIHEDYFDTKPYKEVIKKLDTIISGGMSDLIEAPAKKAGTKNFITKTLEEKLSPELTALIKEIEKKVEQFNASKIELDVEQKLIVKRIMEEDIPLMASNVALLPQELQKNFTNEEGLDVKSALLKLLKGYQETIYAIIDNANSLQASNVHQQLKINTNYIEKIRQTNGQGGFNQISREDDEVNFNVNEDKTTKAPEETQEVKKKEMKQGSNRLSFKF